MTQAEIDQAIQAQIGVDPQAALPSNPEVAQALADSATSAATAASRLNSNLIEIYQVGFQNWANQVLAGRIPNTNPPEPPFDYIAAQASDGWTYVIRGTDPVCAMPPIPQIPQPATGMVVAIGARIANTNYWAALPANANVPNGYTTPTPTIASDGAAGFFTFIATIGGGWWEKVG